MIKVILQGGLGNQMFEYAAAYALSRRNNVPFALDMSFFDVYGNKSWCRSYELSVFALHNKATFTHDKRLTVRLLPRLRTWCRKRGKSRLGRYVFDLERLDAAPQSMSLVLFDYFANCYLFESCREDLLQAFAFNDAPNEANSALLNEITNVNSVSVHIRRGDYLNGSNSNVFWHPSEDWYRRAIARIEEQVHDPHFFFFSDDIEWVREQLADIKNATFVDVNHGKDAYNDLRLMSCCKRNIIANSTFSWWAAWLNTNPDKLVIAPAKYYLDEASNTHYRQRMLQPEWIQLS